MKRKSILSAGPTGPEGTADPERLTAELLLAALAQLPQALAYCRMAPSDLARGQFTYLYTNRAFHALTGLAPAPGTLVRLQPDQPAQPDRQLLHVFARVAGGGGKERVDRVFGALGRKLSIDVLSPARGYFVAQFQPARDRGQGAGDFHLLAEYLSLAQRSTGSGVWDWNLATGTMSWSAELYALLGLDAAHSAASQDAWRATIHPQDRAAAEHAMRAAVQERRALVSQYRIVRPNGEIRWISTHGETAYDAHGEPVRMVGFCHDVTTVTQATRQAQDNRARLDAALASMNDAVSICDAQGLVIDFNEAFAVFHRFSDKAECAAALANFAQRFELFAPDGTPVAPPDWPMARALGGASASNAEFTLRRRDTGQAWEGSYSYAPIQDAAGAIAGAVVLARDVSAHKQALVRLRESEDRYRRLFELETDAVFLVDLATDRIVDANAAAESMYGYSRAQFLTLGPRDLSEDPARAGASVASGSAFMVRRWHRRKNGTRFPVEIAGSYFRSGGQNLHVAAIRDISARHRAELALHLSNQRFSSLFRASPVPILMSTVEEGRILEANDAFFQFLEAGPETVIGRTVGELELYVDPGAREAALTTLRAQGQLRDRELRLRRRSGRIAAASMSLELVQTVDGPCLLTTLVDVTERKRTEDDLRVAAIAFDTQDGMMVTDAGGRLIRVNQAFTRLTGYGADEVLGKSPALLHSGRQDAAFYENLWRTLRQTGYWQGELWNRRKDGGLYLEWLTISAVRAPDGTTTHYVGTFSDITKNKESEEKIHHLAYYDALTNLPNRRLLHDRLEQVMAAGQRSGQHAAVLFLDLDNFKLLNDTRGHDAGDGLLIETAKRIRLHLRDGDTVARLGGDEFVVLLENLGSDVHDAAVVAGNVAEKLRLSLAQPYTVAERAFHCGASVGIALFRGREEPVEAILRHADLAMYQAKNAGRNAVRYFDPAMQIALDERSVLEADLRVAIERGQMLLHYQPQVDQSDAVIGAEALLRWAHPQRGLVAPLDFIPLAEETGLIVPLGLWVLGAACAQIRNWSQLPATRNLRVAINVSARQFRQPDFVEEVRRVLAASGADPSRLKIELTEVAVVDDVGDTFEKMRALKSLGIGFALDDFGTGYSSLSYLSRLPLDQLKIDKSFVINLPDNRNDAIIAQTIITMAASLGLEVIAEGVETRIQRAFLQRHGCTLFQGYLYSPPLPLEAFEQYAARRGMAPSTAVKAAVR